MKKSGKDIKKKMAPKKDFLGMEKITQKILK
jgi:hypothetical protein